MREPLLVFETSANPFTLLQVTLMYYQPLPESLVMARH
jgi:hypothetical protein